MLWTIHTLMKKIKRREDISMNRRIKKKFRRKLKYNDLSARRNCIYCINWGFGCANGHSAVYPNDKSDFYMVVVKKNSMRVISLQSN